MSNFADLGFHTRQSASIPLQIQQHFMDCISYENAGFQLSGRHPSYEHGDTDPHKWQVRRLLGESLNLIRMRCGLRACHSFGVAHSVEPC